MKTRVFTPISGEFKQLANNVLDTIHGGTISVTMNTITVWGSPGDGGSQEGWDDEESGPGGSDDEADDVFGFGMRSYGDDQSPAEDDGVDDYSDVD